MAQINVTVPQVSCSKPGCTTPPTDMAYRAIHRKDDGTNFPVGLMLPDGWARLMRSQGGREDSKAIYCPDCVAKL